jgi:predicted nucleic acid-binding protein
MKQAAATEQSSIDGTEFRMLRVADAHLATLAIEHGLTFCSTDGYFARSRGLRWQNPLAQSG